MEIIFAYLDHRIQNVIMMMIDDQADVINDVHQVVHGKSIVGVKSDWNKGFFDLDLVHHHMKNENHHGNIIVVRDHVQKKKVNVNRRSSSSRSPVAEKK